MRRDDGSDTDIALNKPRSALRDGTPVLIRRLVVTLPPHTSPCDDLDFG
jgi:hypothetical protein